MVLGIGFVLGLSGGAAGAAADVTVTFPRGSAIWPNGVELHVGLPPKDECVTIRAPLGGSHGLHFGLLGRVRALRVYRALVESGIPSDRIAVHSTGDSDREREFTSSPGANTVVVRAGSRVPCKNEAMVARLQPVVATTGAGGESLALDYDVGRYLPDAAADRALRQLFTRHQREPGAVLHLSSAADALGGSVINILLGELRTLVLFVKATEAGVPAPHIILERSGTGRRRAEARWEIRPPLAGPGSPPAAAPTAQEAARPLTHPAPDVSDEEYDVPMQLPLGLGIIAGTASAPFDSGALSYPGYEYGLQLYYLFDHDEKSAFGSEGILTRVLFPRTRSGGTAQDLAEHVWQLGLFNERAGAELRYSLHYGLAWRQANASPRQAEVPSTFEDHWFARTLYLQGVATWDLSTALSLNLEATWFADFRSIYERYSALADQLSVALNASWSWTFPPLGEPQRVLDERASSVWDRVVVGWRSGVVAPPADLRSFFPPAQENGAFARLDGATLAYELGLDEKDFLAARSDPESGGLRVQSLRLGVGKDWFNSWVIHPALHAGGLLEQWSATAADSSTGARQSGRGDNTGAYAELGGVWAGDRLRVEPFVEGYYLPNGVSGVYGGYGLAIGGRL